MDIKEELKAIIDIELKPEFELAINEVIDKSYKDDIEKLGPDMASLVRSQWEQMKPYLFFAYCLGVKAQAVPEKDAIIKKLSDQLYSQEMKTSAARTLCETACELLDDYAHQDAMVILNDLEQAMIEAQEPTND